MRKRVHVALAGLIVALVGVIVWQVLRVRESEPVYQGKRLSFWLYEAYWGNGRNGEGAEPDRVLPALISALHDPDQMVQSQAVWTLGEWGPNARIAVPALVDCLNASNGFPVRSEVIDALKKIDPEAAAKAGVK